MEVDTEKQKDEPATPAATSESAPQTADKSEQPQQVRFPPDGVLLLQ
jgi:hypothetical protein